jgi:hypothetical protein
MRVDAYTRTRIILMNGIENNSVLSSHNMHRMCPDPRSSGSSPPSGGQTRSTSS